MNHIYDAANAFRAPNSVAITATGTVAELPLDKLVKVRPGSQRNKLGAEAYKIVLKVEDVAFVSVTDEVEGTVAESYNIEFKVGPAGAATSVVAEYTPTAPQELVILLDAATVEKQDPAHAVITLDVTAEGTAPSIKLFAWLL